MNDLGKQKTSAQAGNQVEDNVQTQLQNSQKLDLTKNRQLAKKVLATNLIETNSLAMTNGGFDSSWGKLDVNDWKGSVQGDYYQLTNYTGDTNHVIVPNEADFEKAGISTSGKQVGVTSNLMHTIYIFRDTHTASGVTVAFSKTNNKMVKAIGSDWTSTWDAWTGSGVKLSKFDGTNLDVSNITNMRQMFSSNQISDLSSLANLKVDNVKDMSIMFGSNQISDLNPLAKWNVSNVTDMNNMLYNNHIRDLSPLSSWRTDHVTNMSSMFADNQISDLGLLSNWHTDHVTNMSGMFADNQISDLGLLSNWHTDHVTNMSRMFSGNQISDLSPLANWDTSKVTNMVGMFENTPLKKVTLTNWDFSNVDQSFGNESIFPDTNFKATLSDKTSKSLLDMASKLSDPAKENLKEIYSAPIVDGVPDVNGEIQEGLDSIKQMKEEYQQQLAHYKNQIDHYKKELADPNVDAATKETDQHELKQAEQKYQYYLTGDGKKSLDEQIQDFQGEFEQYKQELQQQINQIKLQAEYPLNSVFGNHSKITTSNQDLLVYLVGKLPIKSDATRTIEITFPNGTKKTINQSIGYGKHAISGTADMATHKLDMAMPYELSKWELSKKEDGSYDLVKAHVDKNGIASFDAVQLPKIPGYTAKISRIPSSNSAQPAMLLISFAALPSVNPGAQNAPDDTKQHQDAITDTKDLNTSNMQIVSNQPALVENADDNLQTLNTDNNLQTLNADNNLQALNADTFTWQIENSVADELIEPYVAFNSSHELHLPRFDNYNLQIIKHTSNKDNLSFVYLNQNKTFKYVFNIKIEDGQYLLSISEIENKRLIPVQKISFTDYHQLIKLIVKLINK